VRCCTRSRTTVSGRALVVHRSISARRRGNRLSPMAVRRRVLLVLLGVVWVSFAPAPSEAQPHVPAALAILSPTALDTVTQAPGSVLSISVRLSNALTPPPGIQQARALRDWSARLTGHADLVDGNAQYAYELRVTNLRPQGARSLDYRVEIPLPEWIAPGDYDVLLTGNGGQASVPHAVKVRTAGHNASPRWTVVLPLGRRLSKPPAGTRWYPSTHFGSAVQAPGVVAQLPASPPPEAIVAIEASRRLSIRVEASGSLRAGQVTTLAAEQGQGQAQGSGVPKATTVAWWLDDGSSALGSATLPHVFEASGPAPGALLVIDAEGNASRATFEVQVQSGVRFGCQSQGAIRSHGPASGITPLILGLSLLKRRPRRRPGINSAPKVVGGPGPCRFT